MFIVIGKIIFPFSKIKREFSIASNGINNKVIIIRIIIPRFFIIGAYLYLFTCIIAVHNNWFMVFRWDILRFTDDCTRRKSSSPFNDPPRSMFPLRQTFVDRFHELLFFLAGRGLSSLIRGEKKKEKKEHFTASHPFKLYLS